MMDFAILVAKRGENFIVLYEGPYEQLLKVKDRLTGEQADNGNTAVVKIDENKYRERKQYLEILNEYIESCIEAK